MKRFAALLTAFLLLLSTPAMAFTGVDYPVWDGASSPDDAFCAKFGDELIALTFDPSEEYSTLADGIIQVCFFAYDGADDYFLEAYLLMPQDVASGDVLASGRGLDCSIYLYETNAQSEAFYYAGDLIPGFASNSSFEINIETVETTQSSITMRGQLTAQLSRYDSGASGQDELLTIRDARFHFTLPLNEASFTPAPTHVPDFSIPGQPGSASPAESDAPPPGSVAPNFTLPPNYISI